MDDIEVAGGLGNDNGFPKLVRDFYKWLNSWHDFLHVIIWLKPLTDFLKPLPVCLEMSVCFLRLLGFFETIGGFFAGCWLLGGSYWITSWPKY